MDSSLKDLEDVLSEDLRVKSDTAKFKATFLPLYEDLKEKLFAGLLTSKTSRLEFTLKLVEKMIETVKKQTQPPQEKKTEEDQEEDQEEDEEKSNMNKSETKNEPTAHDELMKTLKALQQRFKDQLDEIASSRKKIADLKMTLFKDLSKSDNNIMAEEMMAQMIEPNNGENTWEKLRGDVTTLLDEISKIEGKQKQEHCTSINSDGFASSMFRLFTSTASTLRGTSKANTASMRVCCEILVDDMAKDNSARLIEESGKMDETAFRNTK